MATYRIAVLPGDGIGPEVMTEALKVLQAVEKKFPLLRFQCTEYSVGAGQYRKTGIDLPEETLAACRQADAILYGATGFPDVRRPDGTGIGTPITLRFRLDLYAGIRPIKRLVPGVGVLKGDPPVDYVIVRENTEGMYASREGGILLRDQMAVDNLVLTRFGTERIARLAFRLAQKHPGAPADGKKRVTCVDKSNVLKSMAFFRRVFDGVSREFPDIEAEHAFIDAASMYLVQRPSHFSVIVAENMFGDILSDLGAGTIGGLGLAPSADVGDRHGIFQPSHGTAPDIAGKGIANPVAQILSAGMMLAWLAERNQDDQASAAAQAIQAAVEKTLADPRNHPADLGGEASTAKVGDAVAAAL